MTPRPADGRTPPPPLARKYAHRLPPDEWAAIGDFVHESVTACADMTSYSPSKLLGPAARLAHWAWRTGLPLEREVVYRRSNIGLFIQKGCDGLSKTTRNTSRSRLLGMGEALAPEHQQQRLPGTRPDFEAIPYTSAEQNALSGAGTLPLVLAEASEPGSLEAAVVQVRAAWADGGAFAEQTLLKYVDQLERFCAFAGKLGHGSLAEADSTLVARFMDAPGRNRRGVVAKPAESTRRNRRAALRAFFSTAARLGLTFDDPTARVQPPQRRGETPTRPLTDAEAEQVRFYAGTEPREVRGVMVSLLLAGAHTGELGALTVEDCDLDGERVSVRLPGARGHRPRTILLGDRASWMLRARCAHLAEHANPSVLLCGKAGPSRQRQSGVGTVVRNVLIKADLSHDPALRPASLTAHAARRAFEEHRRIEDAALLIGSRSLNTTAKVIGHRWAGDGL